MNKDFLELTCLGNALKGEVFTVESKNRENMFQEKYFLTLTAKIIVHKKLVCQKRIMRPLISRLNPLVPIFEFITYIMTKHSFKFHVKRLQ